MKYFFTFWLLLTTSIVAVPEGLKSSLQRLQSLKEIGNGASDAEYLQASGQTLQLWNAAAPDDKASVAHMMALIHFERARRFATSDDFKAAAYELKAEAVMQKEFGGRMEFATKSPDSFFQELVELQALVTAETGSDPLADQVGYYFEKDGNAFTVARFELYDDVGGITVPEIEENDVLALVFRLNRQGDKFVATTPKWLVVPKGELPDVLKQATREVAFDTDGRMTVRNLKGQDEASPKAEPSATDKTASPQVPSQVLPQAPAMKKPTEQNPTPSKPVEEAAFLTRWPLLAVVIVAAFGLFWLLSKKRK